MFKILAAVQPAALPILHASQYRCTLIERRDPEVLQPGAKQCLNLHQQQRKLLIQNAFNIEVDEP